MHPLTQSFISLIKKIIIIPIFTLNCINAIVLSINKKNIFIFHHGWGAGVALSDTEYIRRKFDPASTIVIFFNNGKHNYLLQQAFTDITLRYINISSNLIKVKNQNLCLNKHDSIKFYQFFLKLIKYLFKKKKILTAEDHIKKIKLDYGVSDAQASIIRKCYPIEVRRPSIKLNQKIKLNLDKKIKEFYKKEIIEIKEKIICFYLRYKGVDKDYPDEFLRSSSDWEEYIKSFKYLNNKGFKIFYMEITVLKKLKTILKS